MGNIFIEFLDVVEQNMKAMAYSVLNSDTFHQERLCGSERDVIKFLVINCTF